MDITSFCEKKYLVTKSIQELYDEHTRSLEVLNQYKCENELEKKSLILTIKKQEEEIKNRDNTINKLEDENSKKNKQISEYEKMIRDLEDKMNEILIEKEEENRFDMIRSQSNTIQEKENEIIRLTNLLKKKDTKEVTKEDKTDKKIINVLDSLASNVKEETIEIEEVSDEGNNYDEEDYSMEVNVVKTNISTKKATDPDEDELIYGENAADIAADRMAAHIDEQPSDEDKSDNKSEKEESEEPEESDDEEYECLNYRGKQYWIIVGEEPQYVYEIVGEDKDEVGDKLGVYKKTAGGKMKVFLDKK